MNVDVFAAYRPHAAQRRFHRESARFAVLAAGVRGGKTHAAAREFVKRIALDRRARPHAMLHYWCAAPTYAIGKVQQREIVSVLGGMGSTLVRGWRQADRELRLAGNILIEFKTTERPEVLVGVGLDGLWLDEAARAKPEAWYGALRERLTDRAGWALFSTTPLGRNWLFRGLVERALQRVAGYSLHTWPTVANDAVPGLAAEVEQARLDLPPEYFRREYEASFDAFLGQIYHEYDAATHEVDRAPATGEMRYGVDWGYREPGAIVAIRRDERGTFWLIDEVVERGLLVAGDAPRTWVAIARELVRRHGAGTFFCDPASPANIAAFRHAGLPARPANHDVLAGIQTVARLLHPGDAGPSLRLARACAHTIDEFHHYRWDDAADREAPLKENDHALDALRYALHTPAFRVIAW